MEPDREEGPKREGEPLPDRSLKRKKTVTWADDELELPLAEAGAAAGSPPAGSLEKQQQQQDAAVVVLPCDGLYEELGMDLLEEQADAPEAAGEQPPLTRRQLLERRLARTEQLGALYEGQLWSLLEELRLRHAQFVAGQQAGPGAVWKDGQSRGSPGSQEGSPAAAEQQAGEAGKEEDREAAAAGKGEEEAAAAPGTKGRKRQRQSNKPAPGSVRATRAMIEAKQQEEARLQQQAAEEEAAAGVSFLPAEAPEQPGAGLRALWHNHHREEQLAAMAAARQQAGQQKAPAGQQGKQQGKGGTPKPGSKAAAAAAGGTAAQKGKQKGKAEAEQPPAKQQQAAGDSKEKEKGKAGAAAGAAAAGSPASADKPQVAAGQQQQQQQQAEEPTGPPEPAPAVPRFEDVERLILAGGSQVAALPPPDEPSLVASKRSFLQRLSQLGRLEQSALAAACRELDGMGALAVLVGRRHRFVLRRMAVALGRSTESQGKVDVDLSGESEAAPGSAPSSAQRISRQQAQLFLDANEGGWRLRCTGRRGMLVNGSQLSQGQTAALPTLSHIRVGAASLLFVANTAATARVLGRCGALLAP